ncbi:MAG: hypothetical protein J6K01_06895, partial [Paludibacteraceae bacterium]|nr:hypothetical protein [Paludibacteraceae bacterium]
EQERIQPHSLSRFADAKVGTFSHPPNFSNTFFEKIFAYSGKTLRISIGKMKVFFIKRGWILRTTPFDISFSPINASHKHLICRVLHPATHSAVKTLHQLNARKV